MTSTAAASNRQVRPTVGAGERLVTAAQARAVTQDAIGGIEKMLKQSQKYDTKKQNYKGEAADFRFNLAGKMQFEQTTKLKGLAVVDKSPAMPFTDNAFGQLLGRFSPSYFGADANNTMKREDWQTMQQKYPKYFAAIMNDLLKQYGAKTRNNSLLVRAYEKQIRAVFTSLYDIVDNTDMLSALLEILQESAEGLPEMKLVRSEVTPDNLLVQVVWKNVMGENPEENRPSRGFGKGESNTYGVGVAIRNGETGQNGIKCSPMIWRTSCTNSIIIKDESELNLRHVGNHDALISTMKVGIMQNLPIAQKSLDAIFKAEKERLPNLADVINGFAAEYKWSPEVKDAVMLGTEGRTTKMGVINGISYAAHAASDGNTDLMVDMSTLAGHLLMQPVSRFENAAARATSATRPTSRR